MAVSAPASFCSVSALPPLMPIPTISSTGQAVAGTRRRGLVLERRRAGGRCGALAEDVGEEVIWVPKEEEAEGVKGAYDWREEWYPLYLTAEVPGDAPLGLTVFDKQVVLYRDGDGTFRCHEDRCPHRLAKLSEGQLVDGRLECLYHGWQFRGDGQCLKIPQLPEGAKVPRSACVKTYEVRESQGVVWVWMSEKTPPIIDKLPWFEHYERPGFNVASTIHELPYDHSILLENLMDPAHLPISHDRTDWSARRADAQSLLFTLSERTARGFAGHWSRSASPSLVNSTRFHAPCALENNLELVDRNGKQQCLSGVFLCRPAGPGRAMAIVRFGASITSFISRLLPVWYFHHIAAKVFEEDMGFLASQNEILMKEKPPTKELYVNLKSSDAWVAEYRKWMDRVGHGMPYHFGHGTVSVPEEAAVAAQVPAGLAAGMAASMPAKGGTGGLHAPNPTNRYFRHVVHCKECRGAVRGFKAWRDGLVVLSLAALASAILASATPWKVRLLGAAALFLAGAYACSRAVSLITTNHVRKHRRL